LSCIARLEISLNGFVADVQTMPQVNSSSHDVSASSLRLSQADEKSISEWLALETKPVTDNSAHNVLSDNKSAVDDADDVIESSSPLRRHDGDDADILSTSFAAPLTTAAVTATCNSVIPPALSSLPSLMHLSRQALESRADRSGSRSGDEMSMQSPFSCSVTSHGAVEMFSEDDEQNDSIADISQVL